MQTECFHKSHFFRRPLQKTVGTQHKPMLCHLYLGQRGACLQHWTVLQDPKVLLLDISHASSIRLNRSFGIFVSHRSLTTHLPFM